MSGPYTQPLVYFFGQGRADGTAGMKDVLGGKGAGLAEMTTIGIPVPPGFTIASSLCLSYLDSHQFPKRLQVQVENALHRIEAATGKHFGDGGNPLLVSVRSGAAVSMPGMMETILNLGLNDVTVEGLTRQSRNPQFAWDSYRRFVQMYGSVVFDLSRKPFEQILEEHRHRCKVERDIDLSVDELQAIVREFKQHVRQETGREFPEDPLDQLWGAISAVFESWNTRRAIDYRKLHDIPDSMRHARSRPGSPSGWPTRAYWRWRCSWPTAGGCSSTRWRPGRTTVGTTRWTRVRWTSSSNSSGRCANCRSVSRA